MVEALQWLHTWPPCFCYCPFSLISTLHRQVSLKYKLGLGTLLSKILQYFSISDRLETQVLTLQGPVWSGTPLPHRHIYSSSSHSFGYIPTIFIPNRPDMSPPQSLCTCYFLCLDNCAPDTYMAGSLDSHRPCQSHLRTMKPFPAILPTTSTWPPLLNTSNPVSCFVFIDMLYLTTLLVDSNAY